MILLIDNYDSFVYNLARYVRELGCETRVIRNDQLSLADVSSLAPRAIILSPGPCTPNEAGISVPLVREYAGVVPILGVCLGHQAIAAAAGGRIIRAEEPIHGRTSWIRHSRTALFEGVANPFLAARYHSLIVDEATLPASLTVTARTTDGVPMALEDGPRRLFGLQFHPESVLTQFGHQLLANFLRLAGLHPLGGLLNDLQSPARVPGPPTAPAVSPVAWPAPLSGELP